MKNGDITHVLKPRFASHRHICRLLEAENQFFFGKWEELWVEVTEDGQKAITMIDSKRRRHPHLFKP